MSMRKEYLTYVNKHNLMGSNKASSYVRALDLLGPILTEYSRAFSKYSNVWDIHEIALIDRLYEYIIEQQKLGDAGIFDSTYLPSYWRSGFYSAALGSYKRFLILRIHEAHLWEIYNTSPVDPLLLSKKLAEQSLTSIEALVTDNGCVDFSTKQGKERLRKIKARVNQGFFRKMMLREYDNQCCVTELNIPEVLRASHIVAWAEDEINRLNPANGLCLSATYDAAFDRFLISFDEDYRLILSPSLKEYCTNTAFQEHFKKREGQRMTLPKQYAPDQALMNKHRIRTDH